MFMYTFQIYIETENESNRLNYKIIFKSMDILQSSRKHWQQTFLILIPDCLSSPKIFEKANKLG